MALVTIEELRKEADDLGIRYSKNTSEDTLEKKIEQAKKDLETNKKREAEEAKRTIGEEFKKEFMALKHVKIHSLVPDERKIKSKYVMFYNPYLTLKKLVQFDTPFYLESGIVDMLEAAQHLELDSNVESSGRIKDDRPTTRLVKSYHIEILPMPTQKEFDKMKADKKLRDQTIVTGSKE